MKGFVLGIALVICSIACCHAQNYRLIPSDTSYYVNDTGLVRAIYLDSSFVAATDTVFYNYRMLAIDTTTGCPAYRGLPVYSFSGPSWIGKCYGIKQSGWQYFLNSTGDTILFNPQAALNDSFVLYRYPNHSYIQAKITAISFESVNGPMDSVKHIALEVRDTNGNPIAGIYDHTILKLSQNHGLISLTPFGNFPTDTMVCTITNIKPLTYGDVYDFNVGDVIQYHSDTIYFAGMYGNVYTTNRYIGVLYSPNHDSVTYTSVKITYTDFSGQHISISRDTVGVTYNNLSTRVHPALSGQAVSSIVDSFSVWYGSALTSRASYYNGRTSEIEKKSIFASTTIGSCLYGNSSVDSTNTWNIDCYVKGLGSFNKYYSDITVPAIANGDLVYYKKGNETWGNYVDYAGIDEMTTNATWAAYPNPAHDKIIFHKAVASNADATIQLYSLTGQLMIEISGQRGQGNSDLVMNTSKLPNGLYIYHIQQGDMVYMGKAAISR